MVHLRNIEIESKIDRVPDDLQRVFECGERVKKAAADIVATIERPALT